MEQSFWGKLKRVKLTDLLHIFKFLFALPFAFFYKKKHPNLWLLCDTADEARDNAYWLFRYLREYHKEENAVYAIHRKSPDYARVAPYGRVVEFGSFRHWIYYLAAAKNVSSQKMGKPNAAICYVLEVYGILKNKRAFLQHGIITADLSFLYYEHTKMSLFVTSTKDEWEYVNNHYHYPAGAVQELGLCRFDRLHDFTVKKNQILLMPTWRMYIRNELMNEPGKKQDEQFMETDYYKYWDGILKQKEFLDLIEKNKLQVVFYPHREMHPFLHCFHVKHPNIRVASWPEDDVQELLKESAFLVTDYSSVAMDFAYMKKPLLYYQFDNEKFRSSHHAPGYLDFKNEGFGPVCETPEQVVETLCESYAHGFANEKKYLDRHAAYFDLWDADNCSRNYEAICKM